MATKTTKTAATRKAPAKKPAAKSVAKKAAPKAKKMKAEDSLRDQAEKLTQQAKERAKKAANAGKEKASEAVGTASTVLDDIAASLDSNLGKTYGDYARKAASAVSGFSDSLKGKEVEDLLDDTRNFVRKQPAVAIGVAAAVGFALTRLLKANDDDA